MKNYLLALLCCTAALNAMDRKKNKNRRKNNPPQTLATPEQMDEIGKRLRQFLITKGYTPDKEKFSRMNEEIEQIVSTIIIEKPDEIYAMRQQAQQNNIDQNSKKEQRIETKQSQLDTQSTDKPTDKNA